MSDFSIVQGAPDGNGRQMIENREREADDARLWLERATTEVKNLVSWDRRSSLDVYGALRALGRLTSLRGEAITREYREHLALDPVRTRAVVAAQREVERRERAAFLAGFPLSGGQAAPAEVRP